MTIVDCSGHDVYVLCLYVMGRRFYMKKSWKKALLAGLSVVTDGF